MATITIQRNLQSATEKITTAEQLEAVFNNPANERKIRAVREARAKGDMKTANKNKIGLEGLIFIADQIGRAHV